MKLYFNLLSEWLLALAIVCRNVVKVFCQLNTSILFVLLRPPAKGEELKHANYLITVHQSTGVLIVPVWRSTQCPGQHCSDEFAVHENTGVLIVPVWRSTQCS